jgi:ABC-type uncharacterized transport system substrate-binding protein
MLAMMKRLSLGVGLIVAASAVLLLSDTARRRGGEQHRLQVALLQHASQAVVDEGVRGMIEGLAAAGFVDGRNIDVHRFNAEGDMPTANTIAKEIVGSNYDLVLTATTVSLQVVANANRTRHLRHVFALVTDPIAAGVGITGAQPDQHPPYMVGYQTMQPVRETFVMARHLFPGLRRVGEVWNPSEANSEAQTVLARQVCRELGVELIEANADSSSGVAEAASSLAARGVEAIWAPGDVTVLTALDGVVAVARNARIPVFTSIPGSARKGALFDLGADYDQVGRIAGALAARVLEGADPAKIGVRNVMPQELLVNQQALAGLAEPWRLPPDVLAEAQGVIDAQGTLTSAKPAATPAAPAPLARQWRIDLLEYINVADVEEAERGIRDGLKDAGLVDGRDYRLRVRNAQGDMATLSGLVDAAISDGTDLLMTLSTPTLQAAIQRAGNTPIVFTFVADAVAAGAGRSNEDHLPNVTGVPNAAAFDDLLALIRECMPRAHRLGTLFVPAEANSEYSKRQVEAAAPRFGFELTSVPVNSSAEVSDATLALLSHGIDAICQVGGNLTTSAFSTISRSAQRAGVPAFGFLSSDLEQGAVLVVARDYFDGGKEAAGLAARVMRGESPADIPFQPLRSLRILVNRDAARAVGLEIPESVLKRAATVGPESEGKTR